MPPFDGNGFTHNKFFAPNRGMFHADPGYPNDHHDDSNLRR